MILAIALIIIYFLNEKGVQIILNGIYEIFGINVTLSTFIVYVLIIAIILDFLCVLFSKARCSIGVIIMLECIIYFWKFMYTNLIIGISEIFSRNITFNGYIVLCIIILIIYEIVDILSD